jgi:hypothetical protein
VQRTIVAAAVHKTAEQIIAGLLPSQVAEQLGATHGCIGVIWTKFQRAMQASNAG